MMRRRLAGTVLLCVFALTTGCQGGAGPTPTPPSTPSPTSIPSADPAATTPEPDPIAAQIAAMTTEEKVGQLLIVGFEGTEAGTDVETYVQEYKVGGVILFHRNVESGEQLLRLTNQVKELNGGGIPLFVSADQEGGSVDRMPPEVHRLPTAYAYGQQSAADSSAYLRLGQALAAQCGAFGFNLDFAPVLDVWTNPDNTVIGRRAYGTDAATVSTAGTAVAAGLMSGGIIPVVKHFPGHGDTAVDSHLGLPTVDKTLSELEETELIPFRRAIQGGADNAAYGVADTAAPAVMVAHILMTRLDPDRPASLSPAVVTDLLRGKLGFEGVIFTDDLTMGAITQNYGLGEACVLAVEAGCDQLLVCHERQSVEDARSALLEAVESGRITQERLDESLTRVLALKVEYGLSDRPAEVPDLDTLNERIDALSQ